MGLKFHPVAQHQEAVAVQVQDQAPVAKTKLHAAGTQVAQPVTAIQLHVDELVQIEQWLAQDDIAKMLKRQTELRKILSAHANENFADSEPAVISGTHGKTVTFSARKESTEITDREAMRKALGETFDAVATVSLTDIKKYLSPVEIDTFSKKVPGSRSFAGFSE
jgi:hypothetical protein